ncbi:MAG: MBOAT family protein [Deltaproteobacteria bacterium]|nr:MBOAT family protein [Deltaproteobacteria bacterium]
MLFNSQAFVWAFLPVVLLGYGLAVRRGRAVAITWLTATSLFFYGWWNWRYVFLLLGSLAFNYVWGLLLRRHANRALLTCGIALNLTVLGYFKYANFLVDTANIVAGASWRIEPVALPLAVSFFTFEQITYLVDAYRGAPYGQNFLSYCLFTTFFPRLIAGPIVRPAEILPQLNRVSTFVLTPANVATGLFVFAIGLFKKVILADTLAPWAAPVFDRAPAVFFADAWGATLAFALQLYFDFSGYSDMAIGLAQLFNIRLPENFSSPYQARSMIDFWRRWHITLSSFLRDYLYIPLGGSRRGEVRHYLNLLITMLLGGLWHGASWKFVLWGGLLGLCLAINHLWRRSRIELPTALSWALTFAAILVAWVIFRAPSLARAQLVLLAMVGVSDASLELTPRFFDADEWQWLLAGLALVLWSPNRRAVQAMIERQWRSDHVYAAAFAVMAGLCLLRLGDPSPFLYFQF